MTAYDLGSSFAGEPLSDKSVECSAPDIAATTPIEGGPPPGTPFSSAVYGTCDATTEAGCPYPIEVQSWPECARNLSSYDAARDPADEVQREDDSKVRTQSDQSGADAQRGPDDGSLNPSDRYVIDGYPRLPAASFEGGTRIEIYAGRTTLVVFADTDGLAGQAAQALGPAAAQEASGLSAGKLKAKSLGQGGGC